MRPILRRIFALIAFTVGFIPSGHAALELGRYVGTDSKRNTCEITIKSIVKVKREDYDGLEVHAKSNFDPQEFTLIHPVLRTRNGEKEYDLQTLRAEKLVNGQGQILSLQLNADSTPRSVSYVNNSGTVNFFAPLRATCSGLKKD